MGMRSPSAASIAAYGCQGEQAQINVEPRVTPSAGPLEDLKNDLKPPVVIKPDVTPTTGAQPAAPKD
jgi:hypothetical protein